ncbi:hypothetical protein H5410_001244 [Solanum commersonii]|uniref:Uncharacterized protein n=1 Tax=Solanum commersonii TaxID=4109 RepID=A0A9J6AZK2_SOLCO|nr:hypothetical protein H5410_001244 [Solanum commersonii]
MNKLNKLGKNIYEDLLHYEKRHGVKHILSMLNILAARHKSIITMLEEIRHKIMDKNVEMRKFVDTWISDISPMARLVLEENKDFSRNCQVMFNEVNKQEEVGEEKEHQHQKGGNKRSKIVGFNIYTDDISGGQTY